MSQYPYVVCTAADDLCDVAIHGQGRVKRNTEQLDMFTKWHHLPSNVDSARSRNFLTLDSSAEQDRFGLGCVEEQAVLQEPSTNIIDTAGNRV